MKKITLYILLALANFTLFASVFPVDSDIGKLVLPSSDEIVNNISEAVKTEYSPNWLLDYVSDNSLSVFDATFSSQLKTMLPFSNPVFSVNENVVNVKDLDNGNIISCFLDEDGKISALSIL